MKLHTKHALGRTTWMSIGGVSIIALAGITAFYVDARQRTEVSSQLAAQDAKLSAELAALKDEHVAIDAKKAKETKKKESPEKSKTENTQSAPDAPIISTVGHSDPSKIDVVINKKHPLAPLTFTPTLRVVSCAGYANATISSSAANDFADLCRAAKNAGVPVSVSSSYRSYGEQVSTYNYWVSISGKAGADKYSARPGYSEHQTGLSVDFMVPNGARLSDFTGTKQQKWLASNAWKYGFIQRYTSSNSRTTGYDAESWHFRYIGRSDAKEYVSRSIGSLEQYWGITGGNY